MKACVVHAAGDVRVETRDEAPLAPNQVRLSFAFGGICGSDLHYVAHGRVGDSIVCDPMILGHEFSAIVAEVGAEVDGLSPGDKVAVNPALPCGRCQWCLRGKSNHCTDMRFMGSAARRPHQAGGFAERPIVAASQCIAVPQTADLLHLAMAEPYAVALHAVRQAGPLAHQSVLIAGAGLIGHMLAVAARRAGAGRIVMSDVVPTALDRARALGIDEVLNSADARPPEGDPPFGVAFEASGAPQALDVCVQRVRPGGTLVQVGFLPPVAPLSLSKLITRELRLTGSYRFVDEFAEAVRQIVAEEVDLRPLVSATLPLEDAGAVFSAAADKTKSLKTMVRF